MTTWVQATGEYGLRVAFSAKTVVAIQENRLPRGVTEHGPSTQVTFEDGSYVEVDIPFDTLYEIVTKEQS